MEPSEAGKDPGSVRAPAGRRDRVALAGVIGAALLLRFLWIGWIPGLNGDEAGWGRLSQRLMDGRRTFAESYMADRGPIFGIVQMVGITLLGNEPEGVRFSTALSGTFLALLLWILLVRRGERRWALFAAAWVALDPLLVGWSRIGMEIMLLPTLNTLTLLLVLEHLRRPSRYALPGAALSASVAMQMHPLESVFLACLGVAIVVAGWWRPIVFSRPFRLAALLFIVTFPPHLHWQRSAKPELMLVNSREIRPATPDPVGHVRKMIEEGPGAGSRLRHFVECLDGTRVTEYLSGGTRPTLVRSAPFRWLFVFFLLAAPLALLRRGVRDPFYRFLVTGLVVSAFLSLLVSFYTNTSQAVPGHERYVLLLLVPWWPLVATSVLAGADPLEGSRKVLAAAGVILLTGLMSVTVGPLLIPFHQNGGNGEVAFVTRNPTPIETAARMLGAMARIRGVTLVSQDLHLKEGLDFILRESVAITAIPYFPGPEVDEALARLSGPTWVATLAATELGAYLERKLQGKHRSRIDFRALDGRPVVVAYELEGPVR